MKRRTVLLVAAALGTALFAALFWHGDESVGWKVSIDRSEAVRLAYQTASDLGIETLGWQSSADASESRSARLFRRLHPDHPLAQFADPVYFQVRLDSPDSRDYLQVDLGAGGRLRQFSLERHAEDEEAEGGEVGLSASAGGDGAKINVQVNEEVEPLSEEEKAASAAPPELLSKARETFEYLLPGRPVDDFVLEQDSGRRSGRFTFKWTAPAGEDAPGRLQVAVVAGPEEVLEGEVAVVFADAFDQVADDYGSSMELYAASVGVFASILFIAGMVLFLMGSLNREVHHRTVFSALLLVAVSRFVTLFPAGKADGDLLDGNVLWEVLLEQTLLLLIPIAAFLFFIWGPAYMLQIRQRPDPVVSLDLLLRGNWRARPVGQAVLAGVALGPALAAIPYLASQLVPGAVSEPPPPADWAASMIWLSPFDLLSVNGMGWVMLVFGLWYSITDVYLQRPRIRRTVQLAVSTACFAALAVESSLAAALLAGVLIALGADWLYQRQGILAVAVLMISAYGVRLGAGLLQQPSDVLRSQGIWTLSALALTGVAGLLVGQWGRQADLERESRRRLGDSQRLMRQRRAERDKLLAEFSVARRAQQLMLPGDPPSVKGYQLAGLCQPAREVGGDLYDFLPVGGGKWAVAVADVAGKGLEASLYMTLTKGLLTSVSGRGGDPAEVLRQVNEHYFKTAPRDKFVTLLLGMVEPGSGRMLCASAGHNSPIWRRPGRDETLILKEVSGLALGLAGGRLFDRSVTVKEIDLEEGDTMFFYSDGIPEAMNKSREEYGDERLCRRISETDGMSAAEAMRHILSDVEAFVDGHPASDDVTLVVLRRDTAGSVAAQKENRYTEELSQQAI